MRAVALSILLLFAARAYAEDAAATMAALKDEKSECRYYLSMCKAVVGLDQAGQPGAALKQMTSLLEARRVMVAKHDKEPSCIKECQTELKKIKKN